MDIEKAIETLKKMKWGAYERGVTGDALDMAIHSMEEWKEVISAIEGIKQEYLDSYDYTCAQVCDECLGVIEEKLKEVGE